MTLGVRREDYGFKVCSNYTRKSPLTGHYIHDKVKKGEDSDTNFLKSYVQAQFLLTLEE
jgi:hypothetical protein